MSKKSFNANLENLNLFEDENINDNLDSIEVIDIDTDKLSDDALEMAKSLVKNFSKIYCDENFINTQPNLKNRIEVDLESLRILIKMRKSDEITHDLLLRSIGQQSTNASLYKCLTSMQKSLLDIQKQMDETIKHLNDMLKNIQLELNFQQSENEEKSNEEQTSNNLSVARGMKEFLEKLKKEEEKVEI